MIVVVTKPPDFTQLLNVYLLLQRYPNEQVVSLDKADLSGLKQTDRLFLLSHADGLEIAVNDNFGYCPVTLSIVLKGKGLGSVREVVLGGCDTGLKTSAKKLCFAELLGKQLTHDKIPNKVVAPAGYMVLTEAIDEDDQLRAQKAGRMRVVTEKLRKQIDADDSPMNASIDQFNARVAQAPPKTQDDFVRLAKEAHVVQMQQPDFMLYFFKQDTYLQSKAQSKLKVPAGFTG